MRALLSILCADVEVRYLGWSFSSQPDKFDEVIPCGSHRLAPAGSKTTRWRHVQMGDYVTIWARPGAIARNELRDYTVVALAPSHHVSLLFIPTCLRRLSHAVAVCNDLMLVVC